MSFAVFGPIPRRAGTGVVLCRHRLGDLRDAEGDSTPRADFGPTPETLRAA
jgi:hypothetical protein